MDRIAVLSSGGLDSSVLLAEEAKSAEVYPIYVRCGLAWEEMEREALEVFLRVLNSPRINAVTTLSAPIETMYGGHWSVSGESVPGAEESDSSVYLPGRNILLIGLAAVWCSTHDVSRIAIGSLAGNPFPDATPEFFSEFASALGSGLNHPIEVKAAFRDLRKWEIIRQFKNLPLESTLTCMAPRGLRHCGQCNKCRERQVGFEKAGVRRSYRIRLTTTTERSYKMKDRMGKERIAKFLSRAGVASRRESERLIEAGRVALNGVVVIHPATLVGTDDVLAVDGKTVAGLEQSKIWRYHKPAGS